MSPVNEREGTKELESSTHFDAEVASVDVVSEEEVASNGGRTTDLEQLHEIILRYGKLATTESTNGRMAEQGQGAYVLTFNVTADCRSRSENKRIKKRLRENR